MPKQRLGSLDCARGIGMLLVVLAHTGLLFTQAHVGGVPEVLVRLATSCHMPVFLIVSGYVSSPKTLSAAFVRKELRALVLPYAVTCALICAGVVLVANYHHLGRLSELAIWTKAALYGAGSTSDVMLVDVWRIGGIWFLLGLFWARLILAATSRMPEPARAGLMLALAVASVQSARVVWLPLSVQSGMGCSVWVYLGTCARKANLLARKPRAARAVALWLACAAVWALCVRQAGYLSLAMCVYPNPAFDVLGALAGTACVVGAGAFLDARGKGLGRALALVGRTTLPILCMHILEDSVIWWGVAGDRLAQALDGSPLTWVALLGMRLCVIGALCVALKRVPRLGEVYFPKR